MLISSQRSALFCRMYKRGKRKKAAKIENEKKEMTREEDDPRPLTDEEFREYQEKDARTTKKVRRFFKAIWEAINFFS